jgi:hypothetical protein
MTSDIERLQEGLIQLASNADIVVADLRRKAASQAGDRARMTTGHADRWSGKAEAFRLVLNLIEDFEKADDRRV